MPEDNVVPLPTKPDPYAALNDLEDALGMDSTEWEDE